MISLFSHEWNIKLRRNGAETIKQNGEKSGKIKNMSRKVGSLLLSQRGLLGHIKTFTSYLPLARQGGITEGPWRIYVTLEWTRGKIQEYEQCMITLSGMAGMTRSH